MPGQQQKNKERKNYAFLNKGLFVPSPGIIYVVSIEQNLHEPHSKKIPSYDGILHSTPPSKNKKKNTKDRPGWISTFLISMVKKKKKLLRARQTKKQKKKNNVCYHHTITFEIVLLLDAQCTKWRRSYSFYKRVDFFSSYRTTTRCEFFD